MFICKDTATTGNYTLSLLDALPSGAPDGVNEALRACVDHGIYGYVRPSASCLQAAAFWQQRRHGFQAKPEWITVTPGIDCAMATVVQAFTEPGDKVLINTPIYDPFFEVIEKNDRETVDSPMELRDGRYEFNWADFEEKVRDCRIWMFCNPQNPESRCFTEEELRKAGEICGKYGVLMLSDEVARMGFDFLLMVMRSVGALAFFVRFQPEIRHLIEEIGWSRWRSFNPVDRTK